MDAREKTEKLLVEHYLKYPQLQIEDMFKFLHQSSFGCEHLLSDEDSVINYIQKEATDYMFFAQEPVEDLDGNYCRVHLDYIKKGLALETLGKLFCLSAKPEKEGKKLLEEKLFVMMELVKKGQLPFSELETKQAMEKWCQEGYPSCHHSEVFRNSYHPAYRVLKKEYGLFLPFFLKIDKLLQRGQVICAIEGGSGSGKTTLSKMLEQVYDCNVFHMDDFFLRPQQRTEERYAEVGGNIDRERFLEEVLKPLRKGENVDYVPFDCSTFKLLPAQKISPKKLNIIEGSYSLHPELAGYYDFSVFLDISQEEQKKRILKRNSPEFAKRFFEEWIPMEKRYHDGTHLKDRCSLVININHFK